MNSQTNNSVLITDRLFERFCMLSNDEIMQSLSDENLLNEEENKFVSNNPEKFKIRSRLLNDLLDEPMSIPDNLLQNKPSEKTLSDSSSFDQISSTTSESEIQNKQIKNISPTTLEISSFTTDSLFNSHLIITPICSDAVSPNQLGSIVLRSPLYSSNLAQTNNSTIVSLNSTSTPQNKFQLQQIVNNESTTTKSFNIKSSPPNQTLPSPPTYLSHPSPTASHSSSSLPPPPPPPPQQNINDSQTDKSLPAPPPAPPLPSFPPPPVFPLIKSTNKSNRHESTLVESITAKLNQIATGESNKIQPRQKSSSASNSHQNLNTINNQTLSQSSGNLKKPESLPPVSTQIKQSNSFNKHIDNYLNTVKIATGTELTSIRRKPIQEKTKSEEMNQWKSAKFSLYGLDTDEDQEEKSNRHLSRARNHSESESVAQFLSKRRSNSECASGDSKSINKLYPNLTVFNKNFENDYQSEPESSSSFHFPPPPSQFLNSPPKLPKPLEEFVENLISTHLEKASLPSEHTESLSLPPPPPPQELAALAGVNNEQTSSNTAQVISSSSSATTVVPANQVPVSPRLTTFLKSIESQESSPIRQLDLPHPPMSQNVTIPIQNKPKSEANNSCPNFTENLELNNNKKSFKLDHLLNINPKRLYKNSKFRCKIHDVIRENGKFWLEVIYSEEEERKFQEIFKLFNLCSRISDTPKRIYVNQKLSALYKGDWYRAIVLDDFQGKSSKVKVRFVDLGLAKILDRNTDLREIDEKFFNCPLKALECSIYLDEDLNEVFVNNQLKLNEKLKLSKEARKYFVKMVYKKVLFAKVIDFKHEIDFNNEQTSVCKIKLGCLAHHGVIDVYMYLISKFDRKRYEFLKTVKLQSTTAVTQPDKSGLVGIPGPTLQSVETSTTTTTVTNTTQTSNTITSTAITCPSTVHAQENQPIYQNEESSLEEEEDIEYEEQEEEKVEESEEVQNDNYLDEDDEDDVYDDVLFSDAVSYFYKKAQHMVDSSSGTYYSADLNEEDDAGLDYTPVKDLDKRRYNYTGPLRIEPVNLPPLNNQEKRLCYT